MNHGQRISCLASASALVASSLTFTPIAHATPPAEAVVAKAEKVAPHVTDTIQGAPVLSQRSGRLHTKIGTREVELNVGSGRSKLAPRTEGELSTVTDLETVYTFDSLSSESMRMTAILHDKKATSASWDFGNSTQVTILPDGSALLSKGNEVTASLDKPWAVDSSGRMLPTRYEAHAGKVVQIIEASPSTSYPIVADPVFKSYPFYARVTFNHQESLKIVGGFTSCATAMAFLKSTPYAAAIGIICAVAAGYWGIPIASDANNCLTLKLVVGSPSGKVERCY